MAEYAAKKLDKMSLSELLEKAQQVMRKYDIKDIEMCNILNAKSGACDQNCKFCAQSSFHDTVSPVYPLKSEEEMFMAALEAKRIGAHRFDIVTSGNVLTKSDLASILRVIKKITTRINIKMCASLGRLGYEDLKQLKDAGLTRYHHNIETSERFFPHISTTHTYKDRVTTINAAKKAGLEVCSGGIIGLGESVRDRIDMAFALKELDVDSVPLNILVPIKGTKLENRKIMKPLDVIRTIALFRIILGNRIIKLAAGRESVLKDFQALGFMAGANGMMIGGYLTIKGRDAKDDLKLAEDVKEIWNS
ncbi:MAG: biotin synthase BioB [Candidatus Firestonebacteria bacterium RIFOXYC2_FULL_39_67]|nr:MAG: biotin synthase BioB [Candidatus Firestonebacteria bacterium RIFOXYC2_FULL_39_67]